MSDEGRHTDVRELLVPFSLGELDAVEVAKVEAALADDTSLRTELAAIQETGAHLLQAMPRHRAPADLKQRVFASIDAATDADASESRLRRAEEPVRSITTARSSRVRRMLLPATSAVLAAACVLLALVALDLREDLDDTRDQLDRTSAESLTLASLLDADAARLDTSHQLAAARGSLIHANGAYLMVVQDLPNPPKGTSWQVWTASEDGTVRNVAQWRDGDSTRLLVIDRDDFDQVMISHENTIVPVARPGSEAIATANV